MSDTQQILFDLADEISRMHPKASKDGIVAYVKMRAGQLSAPTPPADKPEGEWVKCSERLPKLGQRVQLFSQGVIQHMMPLFDDSDEGLFWDFEVHDYNPPVDFSQDQWKPLPAKPDMGGEK